MMFTKGIHKQNNRYEFRFKLLEIQLNIVWFIEFGSNQRLNKHSTEV